jgi:hypothetical protein
MGEGGRRPDEGSFLRHPTKKARSIAGLFIFVARANYFLVRLPERVAPCLFFKPPVP